MNLVLTQTELLELISDLKINSVIGMDTEFGHRNGDLNFHPRLSLIQISYIKNGENIISIIDCMSRYITKLNIISEVLESDAIVKVFHGAENDIPVLNVNLQTCVRNIFDTQIAQMMINCEKNLIGYSTTIEKYFQISLPKDFQNSNWLARPIQKKLLDYAANDVFHLIDLYKILQQKLRERKNEDFFNEEMLHIQNHPYEKFYSGYRKLSIKTENLSVLEHTRLAIICNIRDKICQQLNLIKSAIIPEEEMINVVKMEYKDASEMIFSEFNAMFDDFKSTTKESWNEQDLIYDGNNFSNNIARMQFISAKIKKLILAAAAKNHISFCVLISSSELKQITKACFLKRDPRAIGLKSFSGFRFDLFGAEILKI